MLALAAAWLASCAEPQPVLPPPPPPNHTAPPATISTAAPPATSIQIAADPPDVDAGASPYASSSGTTAVAAPSALKKLLAQKAAMPLLTALAADQRTRALVKVPPRVQEKPWSISLLNSARDWVLARSEDRAWGPAAGVTFSGPALTGLIEVTLAWLSDLPADEREALRRKLAADQKVTLPVRREPTEEASCGAGQSVCGHGPHSACCGAGQRCCAGGAAGNYYCYSGAGGCPPLP